jgi:hypothetical protein
LVVRADDMGATHSANVACVECYRKGIARSVEVMAPCAWFPEAAALLRDAPGLDVGIHLTLTSEWDACKWRPLTHAPSLVNRDGFFFPQTSQRADAPPGSGFLQCGYRLDEVERELRAQIELTLRHVPNVTHLSSHMGAPTCMPDLLEVTQRLADEFQLIVESPAGAQRLPVPREPAVPLAISLAAALESVGYETYLFVEHPAFDDAESRALGHGQAPGVVARQRADVTAAFTSAAVLDVIRRRGIELMTYAEAHAAGRPAEAG